jgi:tRNA acetyltransferase TAN1
MLLSVSLIALTRQYGKELYGIPTSDDKAQADDDNEDQDIEQSIEQELSNMRSSQKPKSRQVFTPVSTGIECLFFMKTMKPVEPDKLALKICQDARKCTDPMSRKVRYVNRLAPVLDTEKASEKGIPRVARSVLSSYFELNPEAKDDSENTSETKGEGTEAKNNDDSEKAYSVRLFTRPSFV